MARAEPLLLAVPLAVFAAFAALFLAGLHDSDDGGLASALIGRSAPALNPGPLGGSLPPSDEDIAAPQMKLVNFWASWCAPCRAEHPSLMELKDQGFTVLGVNYKDQPANALRFLENLGNPFEKTGADSNGRVAVNWGVYGVPETFVVDDDGVIRLRWAGPVTARTLKDHIMPALRADPVE